MSATAPAVTGGSFESADGWSIQSNHESSENLAKTFGGEEPAEDDGERVSKAASELGKRGAKAAAEKRAAEAKDEPKKEAKPEPKPSAAEKKADPAQSEADDEGESDEERALGSPKKDPRARIHQLSQQRREAEARAAEAERRFEELASRLEAMERGTARQPARVQDAPQRAPEPSQAASQDAEPSEEQFQDYTSFVKAHAKWTARQEFREESQRQAQAARDARQQEALRGHVAKMSERLAQAEEEDPNFRSAVGDIADLPLSVYENPDTGRIERVPPQHLTVWHVIGDEIATSEHQAALMRYFAANRNELQAIADLARKQGPRAVAREMAKVEARLDAATTATSTRPSVSKAKPPVRPVTGSPITDDDGEIDPEKLSYDEYFNRVSAKERAKSRSRR